MLQALVAVYVRSNDVYMTPSDRTTTGLWMETRDWQRVTSSAPTEVGAAVLGCLSRCRTGVRHPDRSEFSALRADSLNPLLALAHLRTWKTFISSAAVIHVVRHDDGIEVVPLLRDGRPLDAFTEMTEAEVRLDVVDAEAVGVAVLAAEQVARNQKSSDHASL